MIDVSKTPSFQHNEKMGEKSQMALKLCSKIDVTIVPLIAWLIALFPQ